MAAFRKPFSTFLLVAGILFAFLPSGGQEQTSAPPAQPAAVEQVQWAGYWSTQPGFTSTLEMKNNRMAETLVLHLDLYAAGGEQRYVGPFELAPRQTLVVNVNQIVEAAFGPGQVAGRNEGSLKVSFEAATPSALMGSVSVTNPELRVAWNFFLYPVIGGLPNLPLAGVFWFHDESTDGFVPLYNPGEEFVTVSPRFHLGGEPIAATQISLAPGQMHKFELRKELRRLGLGSVSAGGVELIYEGIAAPIRAHGVLYNQRGFSAEIDLLRMESWDEPQELALRTPRFAVGQADAVLGLPAETSFRPVVALHNFNSYPMDVPFRVGYKAGQAHREQQIPVRLEAGQTRVLELHPYLRDLIAAGASWASLEVSYTSRHRGLAAAMTSVSEDGQRSIGSVLNWVEASIREGWYWRVDAEHNTLLGIFNSDEDEAVVRVSLDYYASGGRRSYDLPEITLPARASELLDIGAVVASGLPDADGDLIPPGVTFGGYRVRKLNRLDQNITTEALLVNRRTRSFLTFYNTGCCMQQATLTTNLPDGAGPVGTFGSVLLFTFDCTGELVDLVDQATFSSTDFNVVQDVQFDGSFLIADSGKTTLYASCRYFLEEQPGFCPSTIDRLSTVVKGRPRVDSVQPSRALIGSSVDVTIRGSGFQSRYTGAETSVTAGSGISVTLLGISNTEIQATFAIAATAPAGNHKVTVTANNQTSTENVNFFVQVPTYFFSPSAEQRGMPQACIDAGFTGYFITVSYYVADASSNRISHSGMTPGENLGDGVWHDDFATPTTTRSDGSFDDTPFGACYATSGHFCEAGSPQSFRITNNGTVVSIATNTTSRKCTDGIQLVIQGNPAAQNKTYTFGNVQ